MMVCTDVEIPIRVNISLSSGRAICLTPRRGGGKKKKKGGGGGGGGGGGESWDGGASISARHALFLFSTWGVFS